MDKILDYDICEIIHEGQNSIVYRCYSEKYKRHVIIKTIKKESFNAIYASKFKHQYEIIKNINIDGIVKSFGLEKFEGIPILILEDFNATSLDKIIPADGLALEVFFTIAISLANTLEEIHKLNIIHRDIKPQNIIVNPEDFQTKLTDFGISCYSSSDTSNEIDPNLLEGTLAYMSPEATGRMNRLIDYRSDLYSLGITFYEMLTGHLPFIENDTMNLISSHITRKPSAPHSERISVPPVLSDIVMKLLEKSPEERYRSCFTLKEDLTRCYDEYKINGNVSYFPIALHDMFDKFIISKKSYNRQDEMDSLMNCYENVLTGSNELVLIYGDYGTGKTMLVNELHKRLVDKHSSFMYGACSENKLYVPYAPFVEMTKNFTNVVLTLNSDKLNKLKNILSNELSDKASDLQRLIPEINLLYPNEHKEIEDNQNEFTGFVNSFKKFIKAIAEWAHPILIVLDDLQNADFDALTLLQNIICYNELKYVYLICTVGNTTNTQNIKIINEIASSDGKCFKTTKIDLKSFNIENICDLINDTLKCGHDRALPLGQIIFNKTQGNPFFVHNFFKTLYENKLIYFNKTSQYWNWNINKINSTPITENVITLMTEKIRNFPDETEFLLGIAGCIGLTFSLSTLAELNKDTKSSTALKLRNVIKDEIILPLNDKHKIFSNPNTEIYDILNDEITDIDFKFVDAQIQKICQSIIPIEFQKEIHLKIGLNKWEASKNYSSSNFFDIVNEINLGIEGIHDAKTAYTVAELNLHAGKKSKEISAFDNACDYFINGLKILPKSAFEEKYDLTFSLNLEKAECDYVLTNTSSILKNLTKDDRKDIHAFLYSLFENAKGLSDKVKVYSIMSKVSAMNKLETLELGINLSKEFGINFSIDKDTIRESINYEKKCLDSKFKLIELTDLLQKEKIIDNKILSSIELLYSMLKVLERNDDLYLLTILKLVNLHMDYGTSNLAPIIYCLYANALKTFFEDYDGSFELGKTALDLSNSINDKFIQAETVNIFVSSVAPWKEHAKNHLLVMLKSVEFILESGNNPFISSIVDKYLSRMLFIGENIDSIYRISKKYPMLNQYVQIKLLKSLKGLAEQIYPIVFDANTEDKLIEKLTNESTMNNIASYLFWDIKSAFMFKDYTSAHKKCSLLKKYIAYLKGFVEEAEFYFYSVLCYTLTFEKEDIQATDMDILKYYLEKIKSFSYNCPSNFNHLYNLMLAEVRKIEGKFTEAAKFYDLAIKLAHQNSYINIEALANELAAKFYLQNKFDFIAKSYIREARNLYSIWGAVEVLKIIDKEYSELLVEVIAKENSVLHSGLDIAATSTLTLTTKFDSRDLDLISVIKAAQAISMEMDLNSLLKKLIKICIQNAGAQRVAIILVENNNLILKASAICNNEIDIKLDSISIDAKNCSFLPSSVLNYIVRTTNSILLNCAYTEGMFTNDDYIVKNKIKSLLAVPVINMGKIEGIIYLENNYAKGIFSENKLEVLKILSAQVAISVKNSIMYNTIKSIKDTLELKVVERTKALSETVEELKSEINYNKETQKKLSETAASVRNLLNNASQGFLMFGKDLIIDSEYSSACTSIFKTPIGGKKFSSLIFHEEDKDSKDLFETVIGLILDEPDKSKVDVYFRVLPTEKLLNGRYVSIEYNVIYRMKDGIQKAIMVILTDVTEKKDLQAKMESEQKNLKMVVKVVVNHSDFMEAIEDFENFYNTSIYEILDSNKPLNEIILEIFRAIHTYKGLFGQFGLENAVKNLHELESTLTFFKNNPLNSLNDFKEFILEFNLLDWLEEDLTILKSILGEDYFKSKNTIKVEINKLDEIEGLVTTTLKENKAVSNKILKSLANLRFKPFRALLKSYVDYVEKLAQKMSKSVNPLVIEGGDILVDPRRYHDFIKSLVHIFRNSIDHGIESRDFRLEQGKAWQGNIACKIETNNDYLTLSIYDDGKGIDIEKIKEKAIGKGMFSAEVLENMEKDRIIKFIFLDEFSTNDLITDISGRGIGLAAVKEETERLGGEIQIFTELGQGTEFRFTIPF